MTKRIKSKVEIEPVEKKIKNNNGINNKNCCFADANTIENCKFVKSCINNTLKDVDKKALKKVENLNFKGD